MASDELFAKLQKRNQIIDAAEEGENVDLPTEKIQTLNNNNYEGAETTAAMSGDLASKLQRRNDVIDKDEQGLEPDLPSLKVFNPYTEFKEFSRKEIQYYQKMFNTYDEGKDKFIDFNELKRMMEKLGVPQTHLALKEMIKEVDEDMDSKINFREFLLIFRKAAAGELSEECGLYDLYRTVNEISVDEEGVKGAKNFFEAKIDALTQQSKFEEEIRKEQEEKQKEEEEKKVKRAEFKNKAEFFAGQTY